MNYEIWMIIEDGYDFVPMIKEYESDDFTTLCIKYLELSKNGSMYIIYQNKDNISMKRDEKLGKLGII